MTSFNQNYTWYLEGVMPGGKSWIIPLDKFPFIVGRNANCNLFLNSVKISRKHAQFMFKDDEVYLLDLNSTNGTAVNNKKIEVETRIKHNDTIFFAEYEFKVNNIKPESDNISNTTIIVKAQEDSHDFINNFNLTKREGEILQLLIKGISTKDIAKRISISPGTAKNHILNIYKKTWTHSKFELFALYKKIEEEN